MWRRDIMRKRQLSRSYVSSVSAAAWQRRENNVIVTSAKISAWRWHRSGSINGIKHGNQASKPSAASIVSYDICSSVTSIVTA